MQTSFLKKFQINLLKHKASLVFVLLILAVFTLNLLDPYKNFAYLAIKNPGYEFASAVLASIYFYFLCLLMLLSLKCVLQVTQINLSWQQIYQVYFLSQIPYLIFLFCKIALAWLKPAYLLTNTVITSKYLVLVFCVLLLLYILKKYDLTISKIKLVSIALLFGLLTLAFHGLQL